MEYRWIEDMDDFRNISVEWDNLLASSDNRNLFLLSDFIMMWWERCKGDSRLRILEVRDGGKLIGGLPLHLKRGDAIYRFARVLSFIGSAAASYTEPLCGASCKGILFAIEEALSSRKDWDVLCLPDIRGQNRLVEECQKQNNTLYNRILIQDHMNWTVNLSEGRDKFFETVSWKLKKDLRAKRKHIINKLGPVYLKGISGEDEVDKYFNIYRRFTLDAFTERRRKSSLEDERYSSFLKEFMIAMDKRQCLTAYALFGGDRVMAVSFGYKSEKGFDWALTGFDYELKYFRPGYIMMEEMIKNICDRGGTYCNMYGHDRFFKIQWSNDQTELYKLLIMRRTLRGSCYDLLQKLEMAARSNPVALKFARKLKRA